MFPKREHAFLFRQLLEQVFKKRVAMNFENIADEVTVRVKTIVVVIFWDRACN